MSEPDFHSQSYKAVLLLSENLVNLSSSPTPLTLSSSLQCIYDQNTLCLYPYSSTLPRRRRHQKPRISLPNVTIPPNESLDTSPLSDSFKITFIPRSVKNFCRETAARLPNVDTVSAQHKFGSNYVKNLVAKNRCPPLRVNYSPPKVINYEKCKALPVDTICAGTWAHVTRSLHKTLDHSRVLPILEQEANNKRDKAKRKDLLSIYHASGDIFKRRRKKIKKNLMNRTFDETSIVFRESDLIDRRKSWTKYCIENSPYNEKWSSKVLKDFYHVKFKGTKCDLSTCRSNSFRLRVMKQKNLLSKSFETQGKTIKNSILFQKTLNDVPISFDTIVLPVKGSVDL